MSIRVNIANQVRQTTVLAWRPLAPLFEAVMNSFQAIKEAKLPATIQGRITIEVVRAGRQLDLDIQPISGFRVIDNGIGLDDSNFDSFNTAFSPHKLSRGGKGLGRFTWLKAFERAKVDSTFKDEEGLHRGLHAVLLAVGGFDFVPENLRSATFVRVASSVIAAHQGMNNFYNEPAPMRELASLGTSIPGPALATCMTAVLCVKIGNPYGVSNAAQSYADRVLEGLSWDRWLYYFNECLEQDRVVLAELRHENPVRRWSELVSSLNLEAARITSKDAKQLYVSSSKGHSAQVQKFASQLLTRSIGV